LAVVTKREAISIIELD